MQCWHGTPLKRLGCDLTHFDNTLNTLQGMKKRYKIEAEKFSYFISPSKYASEKFISAWNLKEIGKENIIIEQGYPRNDFLFNYTQEDVEKLFGKGYQLTKKKDLMGGQFASNEQCTIVGLKLRAIENVRILGPVRSKSQVEISATDARTLGIKAPVRQSGDTAGSAPVALVGPKGAIYLDEGCIVAARHIHMSPADAAAAGLKDNDFVSVRMGNERGAVLDQVKIRVDESFTTEMHIDTDEANACQVKQDDLATII